MSAGKSSHADTATRSLRRGRRRIPEASSPDFRRTVDRLSGGSGRAGVKGVSNDLPVVPVVDMGGWTLRVLATRTT